MNHPAQSPIAVAPWSLRVIALLATLLFMKQAEAFLVPVAVAVVLTFVLMTPLRWLRRQGMPDAAGAALLVGAVLLVLALSASLLAGPAADWWSRAPTTLSTVEKQFDRMRAAIPMLAAPAASAPRRNARAAPQPVEADPIKERIATEGVAFTGVVAGKMLSFALSAAASVILLYCLLASWHWMLSRTVEAIDGRRARVLVLAGVRSAQREISRFVGTLAIVNVGVALATGVAMSALDLPNPMLWGTIAGVLNFIPYLGPAVTATLLLGVGVSTFGMVLQTLAPAAVFLLIHAVESTVVSPWFVGRRLSLNPFAVFLSVIFWGWLWGFVGALIAVPVLIGVRSVCKRSRHARLLGVYLTGEHAGARDAAPSLRSLVAMRRQP